ncbi:hypothetical protein LMG28614_00434 [Paraburkholderia ultramafica]|uniref:Uncharacterized protein n=1 Tax=Paraburkholderia ultramafica TaxID=1544867 RepID=A0A6S7AUL0_9BURK|nr:glycosyl hydrolase 108 family protein [Paraburkholderia ultramafica]CAB3777666.1 hypothetical protein LMG28614_00434 [Paraburkholderia ultramafica]
MDSFEDAFKALIGNEGGYCFNPADPGGETMWGVTARVARSQGYNGGLVVLWMQKASGAKEDGKFGPDTLDAVKSADSMKFVMRFVAYRLRYLRNLHTWTHFSRGWTERMAANLLLGAA